VDQGRSQEPSTFKQGNQVRGDVARFYLASYELRAMIYDV